LIGEFLVLHCASGANRNTSTALGATKRIDLNLMVFDFYRPVPAAAEAGLASGFRTFSIVAEFVVAGNNLIDSTGIERCQKLAHIFLIVDRRPPVGQSEARFSKNYEGRDSKVDPFDGVEINGLFGTLLFTVGTKGADTEIKVQFC